MSQNRVSLIEIAKVFLTIGTVGFGGGLAIIALMQDCCVSRRKWLNNDEFLHGIALGQFLGPYAVNAAIFVGYRVRGFVGALVSMTCFLIPSIIFVIILSALYLQYNSVPSLQSALKGIGPSVIAIIFAAAFQMSKGKIKSFEQVFLMIMAIVFTVFLKLQVVWILVLALIYAFLKIRFFDRECANEDS